jgi:hypothetical protein
VKVGNEKITDHPKSNTQVLIDMSSELEMNTADDDQHFFHLQKYDDFDFLVQKLINGSIGE